MNTVIRLVHPIGFLGEIEVFPEDLMGGLMQPPEWSLPEMDICQRSWIGLFLCGFLLRVSPRELWFSEKMKCQKRY